MKDNKILSIEIQLEKDDVKVIAKSSEDFSLDNKNKSLILIALHELREVIINNKIANLGNKDA